MRLEIIEGLQLLPEESQKIFRVMYDFLKEYDDVETLVMSMPKQRLSLALGQVNRTLIKDLKKL